MLISKLFLMFIIYAFIGWIVEVINFLIQKKVFINRGFLIGPYCPIYGVGGILLTVLLSRYSDNIIVLFVMSIFLFAILEYFTSFIMEKIFKARWWDYSDKKFNINGRVCLETLVPFGVLGCFAIYILNPAIYFLLDIMPTLLNNIITLLLFIIFVTDLSISFKIINSFKNTAITFFTRDNTEEITKRVKEILFNKSVWTRRLVNAFPQVKTVIQNIRNEFDKTKLQLKNTQKELKKTQKELKKIEKRIKKRDKKLK